MKIQINLIYTCNFYIIIHKFSMISISCVRKWLSLEPNTCNFRQLCILALMLTFIQNYILRLIYRSPTFWYPANDLPRLKPHANFDTYQTSLIEDYQCYITDCHSGLSLIILFKNGYYLQISHCYQSTYNLYY